MKHQKTKENVKVNFIFTIFFLYVFAFDNQNWPFIQPTCSHHEGIWNFFQNSKQYNNESQREMEKYFQSQ